MANDGFRYNEAIGDYDKAMKIYNRGILFNQKCAELYWRRGCLHARNDSNQLAIEDLTKSIELDSLFNGGYAYWDRAISREEIGDFEGAINDFDNAIRISPEKANFYFFRGTLKYKIGDYDGALDDFNNAIKYWDNYYLARSWRSSLRVEMGDYEGAMKDFNRLSFSEKDENNPNFAWKYRYRGIAKLETGDTLGACVDWKIAEVHSDSIAVKKIVTYCK